MKTNIDKQNNNELIENNFVNFKDLFEVFIRRRKAFIVTSSLVFVFSLINLAYKRFNNPQYLGTFSIMTRDPILDKRRDSSGSGFIEDLAVNNIYSDMPTLIQYLRSEKVISNTANRNNISTFDLRNRIKIFVPSDPNVQTFLPSIIQVNVTGPDKNKLSKLVTDLSNDYINTASETKKEKLIVGIDFLNNERPALEKRANKLQDQLEEFRLANKLIDPLKESESLVSRIEAIKSRILLLESENVRLLFIRDNLLNGILFTEGINNTSENAGLDIIGAEQLLLQEILEVKAALAKAQSTYKKSSSVVLNLQAKLNQLEPILLENQKSAVDAAITVNKGKIKSSQNELYSLEKEFNDIPRLINKYSKIVSNQKLIEQNLEYLLSAREKLELELSQGTLPWKIISKPYVSSRPFKPEIRINLIYGILISLFLGVLVSIILDKIDDVFHTSDEIKKNGNFPPLLGDIPFFKFSDFNEKNNAKQFLTINNFLEMSNNDRSLNFIFQETFRNIYTAIKFSTIDKDTKAIAITSSIPSEGKSLFSVLLALNVSEIDKKVLIIDTDLRRPSLHKKLEVDNVLGLSNVLVDEKFKWRDAVNNFKNYKNFSYITGGKMPPNPIKLLDSQKMRTLVEDIKQDKEYDLIIFDCPPILGLSDSLIISEFVDGVILTVSLDKVNKQIALESLQNLKTLSTEVLGIVTNTIKQPAEMPNSRNKYYYQYKYGYQKKYMSLETKYGLSSTESENEESSNEESNNSLKSKILNKIKKIKDTIVNWIDE